ncbi:hypothetical protein TNCV_3137401 [Trichonephila clavipes]|nr:hypothetical protein TNCV_3137401 [Trichonephila clavipes]
MHLSVSLNRFLDTPNHDFQQNGGRSILEEAIQIHRSMGFVSITFHYGNGFQKEELFYEHSNQSLRSPGVEWSLLTSQIPLEIRLPGFLLHDFRLSVGCQMKGFHYILGVHVWIWTALFYLHRKADLSATRRETVTLYKLKARNLN